MQSKEQEYRRFTGPREMDKAMHTLEGLLKGIASDKMIVDAELDALNGWIDEHIIFVDKHPFNELIPRFKEILSDKIIDHEEKEDILWLCSNLETDNHKYNDITSDIQRLQGFLGGIIADGEIKKSELDKLKDWMYDHEHLKTHWPYDEIFSLIVDILEDGKIDPQEHEMLLQFFDEFITYPGHRSIDGSTVKERKLITGVCVVDPEIEFNNKIFCFTGKSAQASRVSILETVKSLGGISKSSVSSQVDYLIVGSDGNPAWAFACYGRKIEEAVKLREQGNNILIIHENDFWDAVEDAKC